MWDEVHVGKVEAAAQTCEGAIGAANAFDAFEVIGRRCGRIDRRISGSRGWPTCGFSKRIRTAGHDLGALKVVRVFDHRTFR